MANAGEYSSVTAVQLGRNQSIDVRLPGLNTASESIAAVDLKAGGVGYYPRSDLVNIDTGRVRTG